MSISLFFSILTTFVGAQFVTISGVFNRFSGAYFNLSPVKKSVHGDFWTLTATTVVVVVEIITTTTTTVVLRSL